MECLTAPIQTQWKKMFTCNEKHGDAYKSKLLLFHEYLFIETKLEALSFMIFSSSYKVFDMKYVTICYNFLEY